MMDKQEMIESLKKIIEFLSDKQAQTYEIRYWHPRGNSLYPGKDTRPLTADYIFNSDTGYMGYESLLDFIRYCAKEYAKGWYHVEVYDLSADKVIIRFEESKD